MEVITAASRMDRRKYRGLLDEALPVVIRTPEEHARLVAVLERLMLKPVEEITAEEGRLLELLGVLIEEYEDRTVALPKTDPHKMLAHLMEERGFKASDLSGILPKSRVSDILSSRRGISKFQTRQLAAFFRVPVEVFL